MKEREQFKNPKELPFIKGLWEQILADEAVRKLLQNQTPNPGPQIMLLGGLRATLITQIWASYFKEEIKRPNITLVEKNPKTFTLIKSLVPAGIQIENFPSLEDEELAKQDLIIHPTICASYSPKTIREAKKALKENGLFLATFSGLRGLRTLIELKTAGLVPARVKRFGPGFNFLFVFSNEKPVASSASRRKRQQVSYPA